MRGLVFGHLVWVAWHPSRPALAGAVAAAAALAITGSPALEWSRPHRATEVALAALVLAAFGLVTASFARLALHTEAAIARGDVAGRRFRYVNTVPVDEIRDSYIEYLRVPGFTERKRALHEFLVNAGALTQGHC